MLHDSAVVDFICYKENHWGNPQFPIFDHLTTIPVNAARKVAGGTSNLQPFAFLLSSLGRLSESIFSSNGDERYKWSTESH